MKNTFFVTGTDTDIGKTYVSCLLLKTFSAEGFSTFAIKPIASGCHKYENGALRNDDALALIQHASLKASYDTVNPIAFEMPIAPHIAARKSGVRLSKDQIAQYIIAAIQPAADINLIEGVGGFCVPLNSAELFSDVIVKLNIPVVLVVGIKLGCLNHALLTYQKIITNNHLIGWVANCLEPRTLMAQENIDTLKQWIKPPCLGVIPYQGHSTHYINTTPIKEQLFYNTCVTC